MFYGCKAEHNMRGRRDWFEEPFGIQVHSVTVRWSRLIVSFDDVEQAWKLLQAYETAKDDFYVNYRLAMARCFHCTEDHPSKECPVKEKEKEKKCGNCLGRHSVTSQRCFSEQVADMRRTCAEIDNADVDWYIAKLRSLKQQTQRPPADAPQYVDLTGSTEDSVGDNEDMYNDVDLNDSDYDQALSAVEGNSQPTEVLVQTSVASTAASTSGKPAARQPSAPKSANACSKPQSGCNKAKSTTSAAAPNARNTGAGKSVNRQQCKDGTRKRLASTAVPGSNRPKTRVCIDKNNDSNTNTNTNNNTSKNKSSRSERRKRLHERKASEGESSNSQKAAEPKPSNKSTAKSDRQRVQKATSSRKATAKSNNHAKTTPTRPASGASPVVTAPTPSVHNTDQPLPVASPGEGMVEYFGTSSPASIQSMDLAALLNPEFPCTSDRGNSQPPCQNHL
ncbi:DNA-dependent RNA polymerase ii largest subunit [Colletotrichum kahawae]|uniref:DNA-dependent RNA polymerase ii largest subunit n=1 Tax=Colletotrichum kahawae TaxID=34407 RepID=A0AAD9YA02_COLKA|nr:DNA-dependent RNA polymerase ii largest subunit [Colletotrichum kahawae]